MTCEIHGIEHSHHNCPLCELEARLAAQGRMIDGLIAAQEAALAAVRELTNLQASLAKKVSEMLK